MAPFSARRKGNDDDKCRVGAYKKPCNNYPEGGLGNA